MSPLLAFSTPKLVEINTQSTSERIGRKSRKKRQGSLERGNYTEPLNIEHYPVPDVNKKTSKQLASDAQKIAPQPTLPPAPVSLPSTSASIRSRAVRHSVCVVSTPSAPPMTHCDVCSQPGHTTNLVRCDECSKVYHFKCLEPPLNRNPKKRGYSWHCADCDPTSKLRKGREGTQYLKKATTSVTPLEMKPLPTSTVADETLKPIASTPKQTPQRSKTPDLISLPSTSQSTNLTQRNNFPSTSTFVKPQGIRSRAVRHSVCVVSRPAEPPMTHCDVCTQPGFTTNLVRCDECSKVYHFKCLEPPLNRNPKKRGYSWHCADCD